MSVVVPTFLRDASDLSGYRFEVIRHELIELGLLLRTGIVDEIIIVDGTTKSSGAPDDSLMRLLISTMNRSLAIFHDEVDLLQKYPAMRNKAVLGLYDFGIRVVHQLDPEIDRALKMSKVLPGGLKTGKGAALWLATALSSGEVICFLDSDIRNFQGWQLAALLKPILESWTNPERSKLYSKATYTRLAVNLDSPERGFYKLGGRATRLFVIPMIKVLSKRGILKGLEGIQYPLSGEFAGQRSLFESVEFPAGYEAEMAILIHLWRGGLSDKIAQVDFSLFQHFPQSDGAIAQMVQQIMRLLIHEFKDSVDFDQSIVNDYLAEAMTEIASTEAVYEKAEIRVQIEHEVRRDFYKDTEGDKRKVLSYAEEMRQIIASPKPTREVSVQKLPSWKSILQDERGIRLHSFIRRRGISSTVELLSKEGLVTF